LPASSTRSAASLASAATVVAPHAARRPRDRADTALSLGVVTTFLTLIVVLPIAALVWESTKEGSGGFWHAVTSPEAVAALKLTIGASIVVALLNAVLGTITAWVLVRGDFRGKTFVNALIDLPFALPTIVAGLTLLALYGSRSPVGINVAYTRTAIVLALLFVTLPFVVRTVQPVLQELDAEMEQAAASLGASELTTFRRIVFPNILPGILSGVALALAKAVGEFGSLVIITGNLPYKTEVSSVYIFGRIESGDTASAAAVAVVLLALSFALLLSIGVIRHFTTRHDRA
jgi:sulfate transport system permease protein